MYANTSGDNFNNYYKDISQKMKERELDLLIVVNMFLTGFDAPTLNTIFVDKNLQFQGLLQAFSRTNRILNSVKHFGNVLCFRNLEEKTNESLRLFNSGSDVGIVLLRTFREYLEGFKNENGKWQRGYKELVAKLDENGKFADFAQIAANGTQKQKKEFIDFFNELLKLQHILNTFEEFKNEELLSEMQKQNLQSAYLEIYEQVKRKREQEGAINDDFVFEIEEIKQVEVNADFIISLVENLEKVKNEEKYKEELSKINRLIDSSPSLRNKKDLINDFIISLKSKNADNAQDTNVQFYDFIKKSMQNELEMIISKCDLKRNETFKFMNQSFQSGFIKENGEDIENLLPKMGLFGKAGEKKRALRAEVVEEFKRFYERFKDISSELSA